MLKNTKFTTKLFFSMIMITIATLVITSWSTIYMTKKGLYLLGEKGVIATHQAVYSSLQETLEALKPKLLEDIELTSMMLKAQCSLVVDRDNTRKEEITDQQTGTTTTVEIPEIYLDGIPVSESNGLTDLIDKASKITGTEITIFQFVDDKLLRIATTFKKNGKRATGTYITSSSPLFQAVAKGESSTGEGQVLGEKFITAFTPIKDNSGEIIGALFTGKPVLSKQIRGIIRRAKIGSGYFFAYATNGDNLEHPVAKAKGRNIFQDFPSVKGVDGDFLYYTNSAGVKKITYTKSLPAAGMFLGVVMPEEDIMGGLDSKIVSNSIFIGIGLLVVVILLALFIVRTINTPLQQLANKASEVAEGDYTVTFHSEVNDSIGVLTRSLALVVQSNNQAVRSIRESAQALASAATELTTISSDMVANADESSAVSEEAAKNSAAVTDNMNSVSSAMEQSAINLDTIASASEEMGNTIKEIASNSERARATTGEAVESAKRSYADIQKLGESAEAIGSITETITEISEQTNLLALNATIEAARAGEAGKGFAVVANEIKDLASGTAEATGRIRTAIEDIQNQTNSTVKEISGIAKVIEDVNEIVTTIVTAVEEQSITTNEIVGNVAQASQGIGEINENVASSNQMTAEVTAGVEEVKEKSASVKTSSEEVSSAATNLSQLSEKLNEMVGQFKI